ncbi:uncharacterized protein LOC142765338 [Rhipicephalus microplus]|uniref:uncharacterized protein LOC142765338 n=1 Tax=Rhipicephalus microplus TaxID=6941 RepID=UPI003F6AD13F
MATQSNLPPYPRLPLLLGVCCLLLLPGLLPACLVFRCHHRPVLLAWFRRSLRRLLPGSALLLAACPAALARRWLRRPLRCLVPPARSPPAQRRLLAATARGRLLAPFSRLLLRRLASYVVALLASLPLLPETLPDQRWSLRPIRPS